MFVAAAAATRTATTAAVMGQQFWQQLQQGAAAVPGKETSASMAGWTIIGIVATLISAAVNGQNDQNDEKNNRSSSISGAAGAAAVAAGAAAAAAAGQQRHPPIRIVLVYRTCNHDTIAITVQAKLRSFPVIFYIT